LVKRRCLGGAEISLLPLVGQSVSGMYVCMLLNLGMFPYTYPGEGRAVKRGWTYFALPSHDFDEILKKIPYARHHNQGSSYIPLAINIVLKKNIFF
jgi:hypothetical protein